MTVFVHIGHYKTGTTALQSYLSRSRSQLEAAGFCYPRTGQPRADADAAGLIPSHSSIPFALLRSAGLNSPPWFEPTLKHPSWSDDPSDLLSTLANEIATSKRNAIVSSEEFARFGSSKHADRLVEQFISSLHTAEVNVVCYLRRPAEYLVSWYNQMVKLGKPMPRLQDCYTDFYDTVHFDFIKMLRPWIDAVGQDRITLRTVESIESEGGTIVDFLELLGIASTYQPNTKVDFNLRMPDHFVETARVSNVLHRSAKARKRVRRALTRLDNLDLLPIPDQPVEFLNPEAHDAIAKRFAPINRELGRIAGLDGDLFADLDVHQYRRDETISDIETFARISPYVSLALANMRTGPGPQAQDLGNRRP